MSSVYKTSYYFIIFFSTIHRYMFGSILTNFVWYIEAFIELYVMYDLLWLKYKNK